MIPEPAPSIGASTEEKLAALREYLRHLGSALICYSGGIDSALVLAVAHEQLGERAIAITAVSASLPAREREEAARFAQQLGARHEFVESREIERPGYVANGPDRCFHCKSELYEIADRQLAAYGVSHILNGTNRDDLGDHRPGLEAASRAGVKSPLAELGFDKRDVRATAQLLGLSNWQKPAAACLASRIPMAHRSPASASTRSVASSRISRTSGSSRSVSAGTARLRASSSAWRSSPARLPPPFARRSSVPESVTAFNM